MKNPTIFLRAEGNLNIGMGHASRLLSIAELLKDTFRCIFLTTESNFLFINRIKEASHEFITLDIEEGDNELLKITDTQNSIIVLDGYDFDLNYQEKAKMQFSKIVSVVDYPISKMISDVVLNHAPNVDINDYVLDKRTKFHHGLDFSMISNTFRKNLPNRDSKFKNSVLVCFGGADYLDLTSMMVRLFNRNHDYAEYKFHIVYGNEKNKIELESNLELSENIELHVELEQNELLSLMSKCFYGIFSASTILYEAISQEMRVFTGYYVNNQESIYEGFVSRGNVVGLGNLAKRDFNTFTLNFEECLFDELSLKTDAETIRRSDANLMSIFNGLLIDENSNLNR